MSQKKKNILKKLSSHFYYTTSSLLLFKSLKYGGKHGFTNICTYALHTPSPTSIVCTHSSADTLSHSLIPTIQTNLQKIPLSPIHTVTKTHQPRCQETDLKMSNLPFTHSLTHWLTDSLTHSLTHSLIHPVTQSPSHSFSLYLPYAAFYALFLLEVLMSKLGHSHSRVHVCIHKSFSISML